MRCQDRPGYLQKQGLLQVFWLGGVWNVRVGRLCIWCVVELSLCGTLSIPSQTFGSVLCRRQAWAFEVILHTSMAYEAQGLHFLFRAVYSIVTRNQPGFSRYKLASVGVNLAIRCTCMSSYPPLSPCCTHLCMEGPSSCRTALVLQGKFHPGLLPKNSRCCHTVRGVVLTAANMLQDRAAASATGPGCARQGDDLVVHHAQLEPSATIT